MTVIFCNSSFPRIPAVVREHSDQWHADDILKGGPYKVGDEITRMCYMQHKRYYTWKVIAVDDILLQLEQTQIQEPW